MLVQSEQKLVEKIRALPPETIAVIEDFVEFLLHRDDEALLTSSATKLSEKSFHTAWDNPEDAEYDNL